MGGSQSKQTFTYTVPVPGSETPGSSQIYVNPDAKPYLAGSLASGAKNLFENFKSSVQRHGSRPFLGTRVQKQDGSLGDYSWKTYGEVDEIARKLGNGLVSLGLNERDEDNNAFVGIYSKNREEWIYMDLACIGQSITSVPLYDVQQADTISFIVQQTNMRCIALQGNKLSNLFDIKKEDNLGQVKVLIQFEEVDEENRRKAEELGLALYSLQEVIERGETGDYNPPEPNSIFTLCYTSGTTGRSKGAVITHENMIATIVGVQSMGFDFNKEDSHISYLPLAHMMERIVFHTLVDAGSQIGFFGGDVMKLKEDLAILKPTLFVSVPRLFNRFYDAITQQFNSQGGIKKMLINRGLSSKLSHFNSDGRLTSTIWDSLVFKKVTSVLGGRVRIMLTGSAPISADVLNFLKVTFSCPIVEGYGQTETCAASLLTNINDSECGHLGGPIPTLELKLADVPDMNYLSTDTDEQGNHQPRGEICFRGPPAFKSYYKAPDQTQETIDEEGWVHSGDVGVRLHHNGAFKIIDRKKNFFKLAQGEYVAAEKVEMVYNTSPYIMQIFVYGDSLQSYLVAIIVPDEQFVKKSWAPQNEMADSSMEEICNNQKFKEDVFADMQAKAKEGKLFGFEQVRKIHLEPAPWTPEDMLTPTQKLMRHKAKQKYEEVIQAMYAQS